MFDIRTLIERLAAGEAARRGEPFVAPCVRGRVHRRIDGLVEILRSEAKDFEGWGLFRKTAPGRATLIEEAPVAAVGAYLAKLKPLRLTLARALRGRAWLAYPVNYADLRRRTGYVPVPTVHLVSEGRAFERVVARRDGEHWWFDDLDRRTDPCPAERLREALAESLSPEALAFPGLTPEMRSAYKIAYQTTQEAQRLREIAHVEQRLREALALAGGVLREFQDRGDCWLVEWATPDGERHASAIHKDDLTVLGAGICLSGRDRDFDLQSLVGVVTQRFDPWD